MRKLEPAPDLITEKFDYDAIIYKTDTEFFYNGGVNQSIVKDIKERTIQVYSGFYKFEKGWDSPKIFLNARGKNSGKVRLKIQNFKPYCYRRCDDGKYKDYLGKPCEKLIFSGLPPAFIKIYRERKRKQGFPTPYEADILFVRRFLCDTYDYFKPKEPIKPRVIIVDVETNFPINDDMISFALNDMEGFTYFESNKDTPKPRDLARNLYELIKDYDIMTAWNVDFDSKIIQEHLPEDKVLADNMAIVDLLSISRKMYAREIKGNWSLDNVGQRLCGIRKANTGPQHIKDLPDDELLTYNVTDVIIPEIIDNLLGGLEGHLILSWSLHCLLEDTLITAVLNDVALIRAYHKEDIVLPSREYTKKSDDVQYKAAEPDARPGVYHKVLALDLKHAYPSAVISKNISPETKDPNGRHVAPNGVRFNDGKSVFIETLKQIMEERGKVKKKLKTIDKSSSRWKRYKTIDFALKTQAAAFSHGIFGWANSRMRDYEVADAITAVVRDDIDTIKERCDQIKRKWVYCHTDSSYVLVNNEEECEKVTNLLNVVLRDKHEKDLVTPILELKGFYPHAYMHSAARNVLIPLDGSIEDSDTWSVTGMNFMRSETPEPLAEIEVDMIKMKLKDKTKDEMLKELRKNIADIINIDSTKLGIIKPLNKPISDYGKPKLDGTWGGVPYHIKAVVRAKDEYGFKIKVGEKFMILPILLNEFTGKRVKKRKRAFIAFDIETGIPDDYTIDYTHYLKSSLWGKINQLFDMDVKDLEKEVLNEDVKAALFAGML